MVDLTMAMHGSSRNYATQVQSHPCKMHLWEKPTHARCICGNSCVLAALQVITRIPDNVFDSKKIIVKQLSTRGGPPTKLLNFQGGFKDGFIRLADG